MQASVTLHPGQRGTKRWEQQYGDQLFGVCYRYDRDRRKRYTMVELIVAKPIGLLLIRLLAYGWLGARLHVHDRSRQRADVGTNSTCSGNLPIGRWWPYKDVIAWSCLEYNKRRKCMIVSTGL
jgi:hypothetical protein